MRDYSDRGGVSCPPDYDVHWLTYQSVAEVMTEGDASTWKPRYRVMRSCRVWSAQWSVDSDRPALMDGQVPHAVLSRGTLESQTALAAANLAQRGRRGARPGAVELFLVPRVHRCVVGGHCGWAP